MYQHHGRVVRHKRAALLGHLHDYGPYAFSLLIGDRLEDIEDGKEAGVITCLYDPFEQKSEDAKLADYAITSLLEVADLLPV
jgi:FMN phosphatase YigB (HAD superfamily)